MLKVSKLGFSFIGFAFLLLFSSYHSYATHIRAGEITAELINCGSFLYRFTVTGYTDLGSTVQFGGGELDFGDGSPVLTFDTEDYKTKRDLGNQIGITEFEFIHSFPGPGEYLISFREFNRNAGVVNMDNSVQTPFYIETKIIIDPLLGCNNTPVLTIPPIDQAATGVTFIHNPGAYDPDGDSLSYKLVVSKQDRDVEVNNFRYPNDPEFGGSRQQNATEPAIFELDPINGNLVWDSPGKAGEYNMAFIVEEWRFIDGEWVSLGYVTRDMQVIVKDSENNPPELFIPEDTCVEAGSLLEAEIFGEDPDDHAILLEAFGSVFEVISPASYSPNPPEIRESPAKLDFQWQTVCEHVRERPYQVQFKVKDKPPLAVGPELAKFKTWNITVVGPAPEGLTATVANSRTIELNWDSYQCQNAEKIQIWRRVGSNDFTPANCELGMPAGAGYELIAEVDASENSFLDDDGGEGLSFGADFCYRLVAVFPQPSGGLSYVSEEACAYIEASAPVITNVSVEETSETNGEVFIRWTSPFEIDQSLFPPPYTYEVFRAEGFAGQANLTRISGRISDTTFTDTGLDTEDQIYNYRIHLYDGSDTFVDSSAVASTVRLDLTPLVGAIELSWEASVPWSNSDPDYPWHYIYRNQVEGDATGFSLIDSVQVINNGFIYLDDGSFNSEPLDEDQEYCYFITTQGTYGNEKIMEPLLNNSQEICAQPNDTIAPCEPIAIQFTDFNSPDDCEAFMAGKPCDFISFSNELNWEVDESGDCDDDTRSFNVYFSRTGEEGSYELIGNVRNTSFVHSNLPSFAGCYRIAAIDRSGNISALTEPICKDNCPNYELPNVFTPNEDGSNDTFTAMNNDPANCPRFVQSVVFKVYNRWGKEVYNSTLDSENNERNIMINWDGITNEGILVSPGVYYYLAEVNYITLNPEDSTEELKGYIHILK
ncbi:MAG: gliding motility-associated C-terminal domain-containing protein [Candidatus Cyclobacteriaceae bacterium M3_2C_046]